MNREIPVLLLTGYLGSGKTTLLNRILSNKRGIKFAVIVNDIGEVNIDADLIQAGGVVNQQDDSLVALQNGCICCTLKMDLVKQLQDIITNAIGVDNPTYWVLCGDFNTIEASDMSYLTTLASSNGYTLANGGYLGWLNTNKVALPLDNMMCGPNVIIKKFAVLGNWFNDLWSDHYPVYCDLILN